MKIKYYFGLLALLLSFSFNSFAVSLIVESSAFERGTPIPIQYTCKGADLSPPLRWLDGAGRAKSYVLMMTDPDAPNGNWVHWVLFNIPANISQLQQGASVPNGAVSGKNSYGKTGYNGPCPESGTHHYAFKVWALDTELDLDATATADDVMKAMEGHMVANNQIMGTYTH
jgi:hypothetical protein